MNSLTYNKIKTSEELDLTSANTDKAFEYFEKVQEDNLYVVCHSHIMQHIIEEIYNVEKKKKFGLFGGGTSSSTQYQPVTCTKGTANKINHLHTFKDFFKNITDENMWDFDIDYQNDTTIKKITFVRHAFSVANIYNERAKKNILGPASKNKRDQLREKDAKLSLFGILSAIKMSEKKKYILNNNQNVYVSCLIRTWMTAICLFLPNMADDDKLTLIVTPGIKEKGGTDDNVPDPIHVQIQTIRYFYKFLKDVIFPTLNKNIKNTKIVIKIGTIEIPISTNNSNKQVITNIYNKGWNAENTTLIDYLNKNKELVDIGFIGCVQTGVNRFKNISTQLSKFKNNKKVQNTNTLKKTSKYIIRRIANGFPKPNTLQKNIFNKKTNQNNSAFRISRWKEPFSIKSDKYGTSYLSPTRNKENYLKRQNDAYEGGKKPVKKTTTTKKPVKKTTTKKTTTTKKPVKKTTTKKTTTTKKPVKKTTTKKTTTKKK
jgi:hypothetical protein